MKIETKYFGQIECGEEDILSFPDGLFGFETERRFLLIPFEGGDGALLCLQSVETPELAFTAMNPFFLKPDYAPELQQGELKRMEAGESRELCYYVLCVVRKPATESTVNLKCPIVINDRTRRAMQVILETDGYGMRHRLAEFGPRGTERPC